MRTRTPLHERVLGRSKRTPSGCLEWTGYRMKNGYGTIGVSHGGGTKLVHVVVYEALVGPVPEGLELDHVKANGCTSRACVKALADEFGPAHLEPVTRHTNIIRGDGPAATRARAARRTHCRRGHPYDAPETYSGGRRCRRCRAAGARRRYWEKRRTA